MILVSPEVDEKPLVINPYQDNNQVRLNGKKLDAGNLYGLVGFFACDPLYKNLTPREEATIDLFKEEKTDKLEFENIILYLNLNEKRGTAAAKICRDLGIIEHPADILYSKIYKSVADAYEKTKKLVGDEDFDSMQFPARLKEWDKATSSLLSVPARYKMK